MTWSDDKQIPLSNVTAKEFTFHDPDAHADKTATLELNGKLSLSDGTKWHREAIKGGFAQEDNMSSLIDIQLHFDNLNFRTYHGMMKGGTISDVIAGNENWDGGGKGRVAAGRYL